MTITYLAINESTVSEASGEIAAMLPALQDQWNNDLIPIWGVEPVSIIPGHRANSDPAHRWLVFLDDADQAGALAYHDLTAAGLPICKIFVRTIMQAGEPLSVAATHEMVESAVDPWLNAAYQDPQGNFWAGEIADPVEDKQFAYRGTGGILITDFVTPSWFAHQHSGKMLDLRGHLSAPFQIIDGGYAQRFDPTYGWQQLFSRETSAFRRVLIPGSRRERRLRGSQNWRRSAAD